MIMRKQERSMDRITKGWIIRFAATLVLLWSACWAAPRLIANVPQFPVRTTGEEQVVALERYFKLPPQDIVIVGSSLAYHMKDQFFTDGDVRNMAIPGDSPMTGLAIILAAPAAKPRVVAVETNILDRTLNTRLVEMFGTAQLRQPPLPPLRTLAALYQGARDDTLTYSKERIQSILAASPAPDRSARLVATIWDDWNRPLDRNILRQHAEQLKALAAKLEAQGVRVFFFEMPYPSRLNGSVFATTTREVLAEVIPPDDKRRLVFDYPLAEMRSEADGVHLDDRSSVIFAAALSRAIHERMTRD